MSSVGEHPVKDNCEFSSERHPGFAHASALGGFNPCGSILDGDACSGEDPQLLSSDQINLGIGFTMGYIISGDDCLKGVDQRQG